MAAADRLRRFDVAILFRRQHRAADDPRVARNDDDGDREHRVRRARLQHGHDGQRENQSRDGLDRVHQSLNQEIEPPLAISAQEADDHPGARADADGKHPHPERDPAAVDDATQDVAADVIRAEGVVPTGGSQPDLRLGREWVVWRQHVGEDRRRHEQDEERGRRQPEWFPLDDGPERLPTPRRGGRLALEGRDPCRHRRHGGFPLTDNGSADPATRTSGRRASSA